MKIKSSRDLGPQFTDNEHNMIGQDGAYSIPMPGGLMFYFGDTLIGRRTDGESLWYPGGESVGPWDMSGKAGIEKMANNTGLICFNKTGMAGLNDFKYITDRNNRIKTLIPLAADEHPDWHRIWCLHGFYNNGKVHLFFVKVRMLEDGPLPVNFELMGSGIAVGDKESWEFSRVKYRNSYLLWQGSEPCFASAVLAPVNDQYIYLYGVNKDQALVQQCYLARVKPSSITDREQYEYFISDDDGWTGDISKVKPVMSGMPNEISVSFNSYLGCYLAVHSLDLTGKIVARTAPAPWGPWSEPYTLWQVKAERKIDLPYPALIYAGKEHPCLSAEDGKIIYITYVEFEEYYPHLIEVEFD